MTCTNARPVVAVEVLVKLDVIAPVRVLLKLLRAAIDGPAAVLAALEHAREAARVSRNSPSKAVTTHSSSSSPTILGSLPRSLFWWPPLLLALLCHSFYLSRFWDPNVWFQNVEYVAAEKVGQDTVTYFSNIYKYYIAYRLVLESQAAQKQAVEKVKSGVK
jgi:hypothetical protein